MPKRIPITTARDVANKHRLAQVIILAYDGELMHCVTYGRSAEDKAQAAAGGNRMKKALGWPDSTQTQPAIVRSLKKRIAELEAKNAELRDNTTQEYRLRNIS